MPKLISSAVRNKLGNVAQIKDSRQIISENIMNKGMFNTFDPSDIPEGSLTLAQNVNIRYDKVFLRNGNIIFSPAAPDTDQINHLTVWSQSSGVVNLMRFTSTGHVHKSTGGSWTAITPVTTAITVGTATRINTIILADQFYFVTNGNDYIQQINVSTNKYDKVGDAPKAKYICGFGNRIVAANCNGDPNLVAWSGLGNYTEWNSSVDLTAGSQDLVDIGTSYSDPISGLFANDNRMIVLRERSIWLATKQSISTFPFYFTQAVVNRGCDCPHSAVTIPDGICYVSLRYKSVFTYYPGEYDSGKYGLGSSGDRIGLPIENLLISQIQDVNNIIGSYDPLNNEYQLLIPQSNQQPIIWKYNFDNKAWSFDNVLAANAITFFDYTGTSLAMDDLLGTMDSQVGTMDSLSTVGVAKPTRLLGLTNGNIYQESSSTGTDGIIQFDSYIASRTYTVPDLNCSFIEFRFYLTPTAVFDGFYAFTLTIDISKNDGATWQTIKIAGLPVTTSLANPVMIVCKKVINTRRIQWRLHKSGGNPELATLNGVEIHYFSSGESRS